MAGKGSKFRPVSNKKAFNDNYEAIFGTEKERLERPKEEKPKQKGTNCGGVFVQGDIEGFVSPVDGTYIGSRSAYRDHCKKHNVTDPREYGSDWFKRRAKEQAAERKGQTAKAREERKKLVADTLSRYGIHY